MYPTPTPDDGMYGLVPIRKGILWGAGWQKGTIGKWDMETETMQEYEVRTRGGKSAVSAWTQKASVWVGVYNGTGGSTRSCDGQSHRIRDSVKRRQTLRSLDGQVGQCLADRPDPQHDDKTRSKTGKFTFYPMPQPHQSLNKIQVADRQYHLASDPR